MFVCGEPFLPSRAQPRFCFRALLHGDDGPGVGTAYSKFSPVVCLNCLQKMRLREGEREQEKHRCGRVTSALCLDQDQTCNWELNQQPRTFWDGARLSHTRVVLINTNNRFVMPFKNFLYMTYNLSLPFYFRITVHGFSFIINLLFFVGAFLPLMLHGTNSNCCWVLYFNLMKVTYLFEGTIPGLELRVKYFQKRLHFSSFLSCVGF